MLRAAAWTGGLFAVGGGVAHFFPGQFTEPVVLIALGAALLALGSRVRPAGRGAEGVEAAEQQGAVAPASRISR